MTIPKPEQAHPLSPDDVSDMYCLLQQLLRVASVNPPGGEQAVADLIMEYLRQLGVANRRVEVSAGRACVVASVGHVAGQVDGAVGFSGHLDVVPVSDDERGLWNVDPFEGVQDDARVWGRGSCDMKGGLAAILTALKVRLRDGAPPAAPIVLAFSCDEEDRMQGVRALLREPEVRACGQMVIAEPTGMNLCRASGGRTWAKVTVRGQTGHGSDRSIERNAIVNAHYLLQDLLIEDFSNTRNAAYGASFWQPLTMQAGVEPGVVPDRLTMTLDCRVVPGDGCDAMWQRLDRILQRLTQQHRCFEAAYHVEETRAPWCLDPQHPLVLTAKQKAAELWPQAPFNEMYFPGTTDGNLYMQHGIPSIILGPGNLAQAHRHNEYVDKQQLVDAARFYLAMMR